MVINKAPKYVNKIDRLKGEADNVPVIVEDCNTPLSLTEGVDKKSLSIYIKLEQVYKLSYPNWYL